MDSSVLALLLLLSLQAPLESIKGTVNALGPVVDLAQVYGGLSSAAPYNLRWVDGADVWACA